MERKVFKITSSAAYIGANAVKLIDFSENVENYIECTFDDLESLRLCDYPDLLITDVMLIKSAEFIPFFEKLQLYSSVNGYMHLTILFNFPEMLWNHDIGIGAIAREMKLLTSQVMAFTGYNVFHEEEHFSIEVKLERSEILLTDEISQHIKVVSELVSKAEQNILGFQWKPQYDADESYFTTDLLIPLLQKMGFDHVRYTHGTQEFGRDILFSEVTAFGEHRYCAVQVKVGNISGRSNSLIDTIVGQIDDAFSMPIEGLGQSHLCHISEMYIVTSGRFCENAIKKLHHKIPGSLRGSIIFLDKNDLEWLVKRYWPIYSR